MPHRETSSASEHTRCKELIPKKDLLNTDMCQSEKHYGTSVIKLLLMSVHIIYLKMCNVSC